MGKVLGAEGMGKVLGAELVSGGGIFGGAGFGPRRRHGWPRRWTYPIAGALLALGMPLGLVAIHAALAHGAAPTLAAHLPRELVARPITYGYVLLSTMTMLIVLGRVIGRKEDMLVQLSGTDPLTGLANQRRLREAVAEEISRADRYRAPLALVLVDLDGLKQINDGSGHAAGDRALLAVAESLRRSCRATDLPARIGGDELAVLAASTTATEAVALAERIRTNLRLTRPVSAHGSRVPVSVSIGVADLARAPARTVAALFRAADRALYAAKSGGRDRVALAPARPLRAMPPPLPDQRLV